MKMNTSQQAKNDGSRNIIVQALGDGITVTVGCPYLTLIPPRNRLRAILTEVDLLNPHKHGCQSLIFVVIWLDTGELLGNRRP